jgi:hypothetical protein
VRLVFNPMLTMHIHFFGGKKEEANSVKFRGDFSNPWINQIATPNPPTTRIKGKYTLLPYLICS